MSLEAKKINEALLSLIDEHDLSANDIADVIAEQVTVAKGSDNEKISSVAKRLERKFGSKQQSRETTVNYNAKADDFGGYFLNFLLSFKLVENLDGIAMGLEALENAYEIRNSNKPSTDIDQNVKRHIEWYEELGIVLSSEIQDDMYDSGLAMKNAGDLMSINQDRDSILNALEKYKVAVKKGAYIESKFLEKNVKDIKSAHIASAFYLLIVAQENEKGPLSFSQQEIAHAYSATLALGVGAPQEEATNISSVDTDIIELVIKWVLFHYPNQRQFLQ
jgi:hypothetical protein